MPRNNSNARREQRQAIAKAGESDISVARRRMDAMQARWEAERSSLPRCEAVYIPPTREFGSHNDHVHECKLFEHGSIEHLCACGTSW